MSDDFKTIEEAVKRAATNKKAMKTLIDGLEGSSRRVRQQAAAAIASVATVAPERLVEHIDVIIDALNRPEAQTRWECLDTLTSMVSVDSRGCDKALNGAETALFDEESGPVRLAAMRFLCRLGSTTENRAEKTWPLIDEGIQCYHGDLEFQEMLVAVIGFSSGKLSATVKSELADRVRFDATNGKGALQKRTAQILENLK